MPVVALTYTLLTCAILALWLSTPEHPASLVRRHAWLALFLAATLSALIADILQPLGLLWITAFAGAVLLFDRAAARSHPRRLATLGIIVLAAGLMAHQLPGFNNPRVLSDLRLTPDASTYRLHLNFDKTVVGLFLVALLHPRITRFADGRAMLASAVPVILGTVAVLLLLSNLAGYVRFAPKFPPEAPLFLWANLCLTCFAEEAFFRGFIQAWLAPRWWSLRFGRALPILVAALLFGLAHAAGGPVYIALSTLAGLGYGWSYQRTGGRLEAAILCHFAVNALHFLFFTYPALQRP